jgi:hypothetical protein
MASEKILSPWEELLGREDLEPMEVLKVASMYERYFQEVQRHAVGVARAEGRSWQDIGDEVGLSKQTAWAKWRDSDERGRKRRERSARFEDVPVQPPAEAADVFDSMVVQVVDSLVPRDDPRRGELLSAGRRTLAEAIDGHGRTSQTVPFTIFASWYIRQAVIKTLHGVREA